MFSTVKRTILCGRVATLLTGNRTFMCRKMDEEKYTFIQTTNLTTGKQEWIAERQEEHDYFTDIARSSYADMLHDTERNQLYHIAIKQAVAHVHARGEKCRVLDIGTGTGLLSMMAAHAGAEDITAVEVFAPVADVARKITAANGFTNIKIINKHSNEVTLGADGDMQEKANILVTELFDTELIGEGALSSYQHAHRYLVEDNCIAVPHKAKTYIQVVESELMLSWHKMLPVHIKTNGKPTVIHPNLELCDGCGVPAVHDIQLSQFPLDKLMQLTNPVEVFEFDWSSKTLTDKPRNNLIKIESKKSGTAHAILSWWDLSMDTEGKHILSTAPCWCHPHGKQQAWRDHWMQSVYFPPQQVSVNKGDKMLVSSNHDAYSMWFKIENNISPKIASLNRPVCEYPPRMLWSRPRCAMINDAKRNQSYADAVQNLCNQVPKNSDTLCISDFSVLPLLVAKNGVNVVVVEQTDIGRRGLVNIARHNDINLHTKYCGIDEIVEKLGDKKFTFLCAEPFFKTSYLPWHDLYFWYVRSRLESNLLPDCKIMPRKAHLCFAAVQFKDLWKIRAPVKSVEGFDVSLMDHLIGSALEMKEYYEAEAHALWEYPNVLLTKPTKALAFDFMQCVSEEQMHAEGRIELDIVARQPSVTHCHAVVLWMEYDLDGTVQLSNGLICDETTQKINPDNPNWYMHQRQAVFFLKHAVDLRKPESNNSHAKFQLHYCISFLPKTGEMRMKFEVY